MHELAMTECVLGAVVRHARGRRVTRLQLQVGRLQAVVPSALEFNWDLVARGTVAEGSELTIEVVDAVGRCRLCGVETLQDGFPMRCGACGALDLEVVGGEELVVDWLEVETTAGGGRTAGTAGGGEGAAGRPAGGGGRGGAAGGIRRA